MRLEGVVELFAASLAPIIAIFGSIIAWQNYQLAKRRRKDELFDRRYEFYMRFRASWLSTSDEDQPPVDIEDLIPIAEEARFLFGKDISQHILSLANHSHSGHPEFPDSDFVQPFNKYLSLEDKW